MSAIEGWGRPGSLKWHRTILKSCDNSIQLAEHVKLVTGKILNKNNPFGVVKKNAIKLVEEYFSNDNKRE